MASKNKTLSYYALIIIISIVLIRAQTQPTTNKFNASNIDTWASSAENIKNFEKLSTENRNSAWEKANPEQKNNFLNAYSKSKTGKDIAFSNFEHKDLKWYNNQLYVKNADKWISVDLTNLRDSLKSVKYDDKTKTMLYEFEKGDIKTSVKIDDGYIDKDGNLVKFKQGTKVFGVGSSDSSTILANVMYGNGPLEFKNGQFTIPKGSEKMVMIGNSFYSNFDKDHDTIIKPPTDPSAPSFVYNAKISMLKNPNDITISAELKTTYGLTKDGKPMMVAFFDGKEVTKGFKEPYTAVDLTKGIAIIDDNKKITGRDTYMHLQTMTDLKNVLGTGSQAWFQNGEAELQFFNGNILMSDGTNKGLYSVSNIKNLDNLNKPDTEVYTFLRSKDGEYTDFISKDLTLVESGALVSETSGMYVQGPRGKVLGGQSETGYSDLKYYDEYSKERFKGSEEERLAAIARDKGTVATIHGTPSITLPGQYVAAELLTNLDYQMAVASLDEGGKDKLEKGLNQLDLILTGKDTTDPEVRELAVRKIVDGEEFLGKKFPGIRARDEYKGLDDFALQQKAEELIDAYSISRNYDPNFPYDKVTAENIDKMPSVNRLLYELSKTYEGSVNIPEKATLKARPSSSGGLSELQFRGDGVYVDGEKVPGVSPQVATAFRNSVSGQLLNFEGEVAERQAKIDKYGVEKIQQAGYAFDPTDYKTERHESNVYYTRLIGARQVGQMAFDSARGQVSDRESQVNYYKSKGRLP